MGSCRGSWTWIGARRRRRRRWRWRRLRRTRNGCSGPSAKRTKVVAAAAAAITSPDHKATDESLASSPLSLPPQSTTYMTNNGRTNGFRGTDLLEGAVIFGGGFVIHHSFCMRFLSAWRRPFRPLPSGRDRLAPWRCAEFVSFRFVTPQGASVAPPRERESNGTRTAVTEQLTTANLTNSLRYDARRCASEDRQRTIKSRTRDEDDHCRCVLMPVARCRRMSILQSAGDSVKTCTEVNLAVHSSSSSFSSLPLLIGASAICIHSRYFGSPACLEN